MTVIAAVLVSAWVVVLAPTATSRTRRVVMDMRVRTLRASIPVFVGLALWAGAARANPAPQVEWTRQYGGAGGTANETGTAIAADGQGNTYVAGQTTGKFPGEPLAGGPDAFVRKYDWYGNVRWTRQFGTSALDSIAGICVDPEGFVYVAGTTQGTLPGQTSAGLNDAFVRKYDADGNEKWTRQFGSGTNVTDVASAVAADGTGVYVAGNVAAALPGQTQVGNADIYVRKYDVDGNEKWTRQFGSTRYESPAAIFVNPTGVYVAGQTEGAIQSTDGLPQTNHGSVDAFVRKYNVDGGEVWTRTFGTVRGDYAKGVSGDASGIYITGYTNGTLTSADGTQIPTIAGGNDTFIRKYDWNGAEEWTRQLSPEVASANDMGHAVFADATGVYVGGMTNHALPGKNWVGSLDAFIVKFDTNGGILWTDEFGSPNNDFINGISGDSFGVYVTGFAAGTLPSQPLGGDEGNFIGSQDAFVRKYDTNGNTSNADGSDNVVNGVSLWTRQSGTRGPATDAAEAVASDGNGNIYVAGSTSGSLPGKQSAGVYDAYVRKYDADGVSLWTRQFGTSDADFALAVAVDESGVYVAGNTNQALPGQAYGGGGDVFIRKYDVGGNELWTREFGTPASDGLGGIAIDASGVYVAGQTQGTLPGQTSGGTFDAFIRKYDMGGNELWTRQFGTIQYDDARAIAADATGVYVTGRTDGALDDPLLPLTFAGSSDAYVRKYGHDGTHLWTRQL